MNQRTINVVCLLLAVAGISFSVGQAFGQDRAQAVATTPQPTASAASDRAVLRQLKLIYRVLFDSQLTISGRVRDTNEKLDQLLELDKYVCLNVQTKYFCPGQAP
jgi:hypothetical protein